MMWKRLALFTLATFIISYLSYGILLWGVATGIQSSFVLQKRAIRVIYNLGPRESF